MIRDNLLKIKERIYATCSKVNQDPRSVTIVCVSKGRTIKQIREAIEAGITDIGENRVQEALAKYSQLLTGDQRPTTIKWHLVGHLQTNKVKETLEIFDLIQSVDSLHLAREIDKQAAKINKVQEVLIEIKTSPEVTKFGLKPEETPEVIQEIAKLKNMQIKGLMTIAPLLDNPEKARPYFKRLKDLFDEINRLSTIDCRLSTISMGMTDDFEIAIEEGANMVRLGRAIFEGIK